jgi:hypothetical protein
LPEEDVFGETRIGKRLKRSEMNETELEIVAESSPEKDESTVGGMQ